MKLDEEILAVFRAEISEQLDVLERRLVGPGEGWDLAELCRLAHNVKGAARMVGAISVSDAAHTLEDVLVDLREGKAGPEATALARRGGRELAARFADLVSSDEPARGEDWAAPAAETGESEAAARLRPGGGVARSRSTTPVRDTVRIAVTKVDALTDLVTEGAGDAEAEHETEGVLTAVEGLRARYPELAASPELAALHREVRSLGRRLTERALRARGIAARQHEAVRALRMVPLSTLASLLGRVVDEAAEVTGREVALELEGDEIELDRAVLDALRDPLVHLLRNAVAHGIEVPEARRAAGKPPSGRVRLEARPAGTRVELVVRDDGAGVDMDAVRRRAKARGLLTDSQAPAATEGALLDLLFEPAFSTAAAADGISGRGIGLDVARRNLTELGGNLDVTTRTGEGTAFKMQVPLTRLVTRGVVLRLGRQLLAAPVEAVARTALVDPREVERVDGGDVVRLDGTPLTVAALEDLLRLPARDARLAGETVGAMRRPLVVLSARDRRIGLFVDEVLGSHEYVAQPLGWNLPGVPGVAGAAIVGREVVMLLDAPALLEAAGRLPGRRAAADREAVRRRILVVDDSVTSRVLERNILASAGYDVSVAIDGQAAWDVLAGEPPDLLVTDVEMPNMDGFELTRRVRADARLASLPVILVTSLGNDEHRQRGAEVGANAYVVKGAFDQDELLTHVARLL